MRLEETEYKVILAGEYGIFPNRPEGQEEQMKRLFAEAEPGSRILFEPGTYQIGDQIPVRDKKGLTIFGEGALFVSRYEPDMGNGETPGLFYFYGCEDLKLQGFDVTTDRPANCTGTVVAKNPDEGTYDFRPAPGFSMTGRERAMAQNSFDSEGTPDYHLFCYQENPYEVLENGDIRIRLTENPKEQLERLLIGQRVCIRHTVYGTEHFIFESCLRVALEDIHIYGSPGSVVKLLPHCADFSFERFCICLPKESGRLMSSNADGIHIKGLSGSLSLKDCYFEQLGDDALNIHSRGAVVTKVDTAEHRICCASGWKEELAVLWAEAGAVLEVYDPASFLKKASVLVESFGDSCIRYSSLEGEVAEGDVLANSEFFASVHIDHCVVKNSRARGFLIQSRNVLIENCTLYGISLAAILVAPDIAYWYEMGPSRNVSIRNNHMEKCAVAQVEDNMGVIIVKASHGVGYASYPCGVHRDIAITENEFEHNSTSAVFVSATDGITIAGNQIERCEPKAYEKRLGDACAIALRNCSRVTVENNVAKLPRRLILSASNCTTGQGQKIRTIIK